MGQKLQSTSFRKSLGLAIERLELWAFNPWRRYSFLLIIILVGFFLGSSVGTINGALALMDPVGAFIIVLILEVMIRLRRTGLFRSGGSFSTKIIDSFRMGLLYGLLLEGFKLL